MKVFISWSGESSKKIVSAIHDWLPTVLQNVKPYMSAENIEKGERWSIDIANQLQETNYGIICVTPDNINAPWILFESGALSKSMTNAKVSPIIFGLSPSDLSKSPLLQFQASQFNKGEMLKIVRSINSSAPEGEQISRDVTDRAFNRAWQELEDIVSGVELIGRSDLSHSPPIHTDQQAFRKIEEAVEEILSNSRTQLKILNSPADLLPSSYLAQVFVRSSVNRRDLSRSHPVWADIERCLFEFKNHLDSVELALDFDAELGREKQKEDNKSLKQTLRTLTHAIDFLRHRLNKDSLIDDRFRNSKMSFISKADDNNE